MLSPSQTQLDMFDRVKKAISDAEHRGTVYLTANEIAWHVLGEKGEPGPKQLIGRALHAMERDGHLQRFNVKTWIIVKNKKNKET